MPPLMAAAGAAVVIGAGLYRYHTSPTVSADDEQLLTFKEDRYNGVEMKVPAAAASRSPAEFERLLRTRVEGWAAAGKGGLWLTIPLECAALAGVGEKLGFTFHHAKPTYVLMTRWLLPTASPLPAYAFTQIGVGGVVVNKRGEVLMVQERISPLSAYQGSWKLPGGLADPGEHFAETVAREVREETGVESELVGVVSMRHTHGVRFGQSDLYVVVKLLATTEEIKIDEHELMGAKWMARSEIEAKLAADGEKVLNGKISSNNWKMILPALEGTLIGGEVLPKGGHLSKPAILYSAGASRL